ncbi:MAG: hypothetical protein J6S57_01700 [Alphaproteobacteria bacterium]|nr:hypothetical protein [Alphaproteobacteria bacterium]
MRLKSKHKRGILWGIIVAFGILLLAFIIVPPMIHLDSLKPKIEEIILNQTGVPAKINGKVNISLLGRTTIVAHNVSIPNGVISTCEFTVPLYKIFNIKNANITSDIDIKGASLTVEKITPFNMDTNINLKNSKIKFLNKEYQINYAKLSKQLTTANIETDQHTYQITSIDNKFLIKNKNNELTLDGTLYENGTASARINITAENINRWFEFEKPKITGRFPITANIKWDGGYGIDFSDISANGMTGYIILQNNGYKKVNLTTQKADLDVSFILHDSEILKNAEYELDFYGKIKFIDKTFKHLYVHVVGFNNEIKIQKLIADNIVLEGGTIDKYGAHNISISILENNKKTSCVFNGTPNEWTCDKFSYDNKIFGKINVNREKFDATITSKIKFPDINLIANASKRFGNRGTIQFDFADASGVITIENAGISVKYNFVKNKNLDWTDLDLPFLPESMKQENGDFVWQNDTMIFVPHSEQWNISVTKDYFSIIGNNFKKWFPNLNLKFALDLPYKLSGNYKRGNISNLILEIANHKFIGSCAGKSATLTTNILNLDSFLSKKYFDNLEQNSFLNPSPITTLFNLDLNFALSAKTLIFRGQRYNNFVYSLKPNTQVFSITDSNRGNLLATIIRDNTNYDINIQLNKFVLDNKILPNKMPVNISNSTITAEIKLKTSGKIGHDIYNNLHGTFDATFNGGILHGFGFEEFYASANKITLLNAEYALSKALNDGTTPIKKMHIIGTYNMGDIKTTRPLTLSMHHIDAMGEFKIQDKKMFMSLNLILRGTSPSPAPIEISIYDDGFRDYYLYEIMNSFDPDYMRSFVESHNKF